MKIDFLQIRDVNDNAPVWATPSVSIRLNRSRDDAVDLSATDADAGEQGIKNTLGSPRNKGWLSQLFVIRNRTFFIDTILYSLVLASSERYLEICDRMRFTNSISQIRASVP